MKSTSLTIKPSKCLSNTFQNPTPKSHPFSNSFSIQTRKFNVNTSKLFTNPLTTNHFPRWSVNKKFLLKRSIFATTPFSGISSIPKSNFSIPHSVNNILPNSQNESQFIPRNNLNSKQKFTLLIGLSFGIIVLLVVLMAMEKYENEHDTIIEKSEKEAEFKALFRK